MTKASEQQGARTPLAGMTTAASILQFRLYHRVQSQQKTRTKLTAQGPKSKKRPSKSNALSRCTWLSSTWKSETDIEPQQSDT